MTARGVTDRGDTAHRLVPLLASTGISVTGDGAFITAAPLFAAAITHNPVSVSTITASFYIPWLVVALPAGAMVDRWPRRLVMLMTDLIRACIIFSLIAAIFLKLTSVPLIAMVTFCAGATQCFFDSAAQSIISRNNRPG
jgi:MFS family permease